MSDTRAGKKIFNWKGRPKYRWEDNIKQDICHLKIKNWIACVQDRGKWKEVVEKAKTFNHERKFSAWKKKKIRNRRPYPVYTDCHSVWQRPSNLSSL
jgi:hypothetical protein